METDAQNALLAAAQSGDDRAFDTLTSPHRRALLAHCYRMLGSFADADDAVQEALVRSWRHLPGFEGRASVRTWLFSIATRTCLDFLEHRAPRRVPSLDDTPAGNPARPPARAVEDPVWLEPLPDAAWCDGDMDQPDGPEAVCTRRESVAVAFLAAIQMLSPTQRAVLLLHDVAGWKAAEVADALGTTAASVNSSLQRARATLDERAPSWNRRPRRVGDAESSALGRYLRAWNSGDAKALAAVLREDVVIAMPPVPTWFRGREDFAAFFAGFLLSLPWRLKLVAAPDVNGRPALAAYRTVAGKPGVLEADALHVFSVDARGEIEDVLVFLGPGPVTRCGLPGTLRDEGNATSG